MNSLFVTNLLLFLCVLWVNPSLTTGRKTRVPKVKCFKEYKPNSCKKKMPGRFTFKDCCQVNRGAAYQIGSKRSKRKCLPCSKEENWSVWSKWGECNSPCGPGISRRTRVCVQYNGTGCPGRRSEKKKCVNPEIPNCPINGGWSNWGNWSSCSVTCGEGRQQRYRSCTNPKPQYGGRDCQGVREDKQRCTDTEYCPIHGGWGNWSPWSNCPVTCDVGWSQRVRECNNPKPRYNGTACKESESSERRTCSTYVTCGGSASGSGSGDFSGSSGDGSGSGRGSGSGMKSIQAMDERRGSGEDSVGNETSIDGKSDIKDGSDFDFS